jgi:sterol desaturase/sphingolipid hydroxylase (fatty acid hydroxylase superfamily)
MKPSPVITAALLGFFALLLLAQQLFPLRERRKGLLARFVVNGCLTALVFLAAALVVRPSALQTLNWAAAKPFGLVHLVPLPSWARFIAGFLLLDLSFYYWHRANHKVPWLWRFHNVHHIDPDLDVSTGFRFHFGEVLFSTVFRVVQVSLIGVSFTTFAIYELVFQANTLFHHSNVRLPIRLERLLNQILVTPRMHGIHHSQVRDETNSNYGVVFCWWDKLHRTLGLNIPQSKIEIGVAGYSGPEDNRLWRMLIIPFIKQRDYWSRPDGSTPKRKAEEAALKAHELAE